MKKKAVWGIICLLLIVTGCGTSKVWRSSPAIQTASNPSFEAKLEPLKAEGYDYFNAFRFTFTNKTKTDLQIEWIDSHYLVDGKRISLFAFDNTTQETINSPPLDSVSAGDTLTKKLYPVKAIGWEVASGQIKNTEKGATFSAGPLPAGENGIRLAVRQGEKAIREKITVDIAFTEVRQ